MIKLTLDVLDVVEISADEVVVLFRRSDGSIGEFPTTARDYEFLQQAPEPVKREETPEERRARLVAEARARLAGEPASPALPEKGPSARGAAPSAARGPAPVPSRPTDPAPPPSPPSAIVALPTGSPKTQVEPGSGEEEDPGRDEAQRVIDSLKLNVRVNDVTSTLFRVNDEATSLDGGNIPLNEASRLVDAIYSKTLPKVVRDAALRRLHDCTLATLYKLRAVIPRDLAMWIARSRCQSLGSGQGGIGGNYIPADWVLFIEGDTENGPRDLMLAAGRDSVFEPVPPPMENKEVIAAIDTDLPAFGGGLDRKGNIGSLEARYAGMSFQGNVDLRERD